MAKWFVYNSERYYPDAQVIEAETPQEAAEKYDSYNVRHRVFVFPWDSLAYEFNPHDDEDEYVKEIDGQ